MGNIDITTMGFSGRMGPTVAYVVNGEQRFRTYTKPNNPKTEKQTVQRSRFGFVSSKLSSLYKEIKIGFNDSSLNYGTVCGKVNREAVVGQFPDVSIDYSKIKIAEGKLQVPANASVNCEETNISGEKSIIANFKWNTELDPITKWGSENDIINIVCYNETMTSQIFRYRNIKRYHGKASIELPEHWIAVETHFWVYATSWNRDINSDSVYVPIQILI